MLQALIDESDSHDVSPRIFIIGGYIAPLEKWRDLTDAWQAELGQTPKLDYFSFREAFPTSGRPRGQFRGMTFTQRDARAAKFRKVIEKYVDAEVAVGFQVGHYQQAYSWCEPMKNNHYLFVIPVLLPMIARHIEQVEFIRQPIDFIFDDRKIDEPKVLDAWYYTKEYVQNPDPPDLFEKILVNAPMFRGSRDIIALQAADMFAGSTRAANIAFLNGREPMPLPGSERNIRGIYLDATEDALRQYAEEDRKRLADRGPTLISGSRPSPPSRFGSVAASRAAMPDRPAPAPRRREGEE